MARAMQLLGSLRRFELYEDDDDAVRSITGMWASPLDLPDRVTKIKKVKNLKLEKFWLINIHWRFGSSAILKRSGFEAWRRWYDSSTSASYPNHPMYWSSLNLLEENRQRNWRSKTSLPCSHLKRYGSTPLNGAERTS